MTIPKTQHRIRMSKGNGKNRQSGFIVTTELLLITVILVIGLVSGMAKVRDQTIAELSDTGSAIGATNQSYIVVGTLWGDFGTVAATAGWEFEDAPDLAAIPGTVGGDGQQVEYSALPTPSTTASGVGEGIVTY